MARFFVTYRVQSDVVSIEARAQAIAVEQSVEMPLEAIEDPHVLTEIVGRVESISDRGHGLYDVRIGLACSTVEADAAQLLNMAFGNTSLHNDVTLLDIELPAEMARRFGGPRHGINGLRARVGGFGRALTCAAIKPLGLSAEQLSRIAGRLALGGIDFIKDDHGLADQAAAPFAERVSACAAAVRQATAVTGHRTQYVPSLSGSFPEMRRQLALAREAGISTVLTAPLLAGFANMQSLAAEFPDMAIITHPTMGGAARILPELLIGRLFRLIGADAVIFPNFGGRFSYSAHTCRNIAGNAVSPQAGLCSAMPVPAGGMSLERVPEMLDFYGKDVMLLIGGSLLSARERMSEAARAFADRVAAHRYEAA